MVRIYFSLILFLHLFILSAISAQTTAIPDTAFEQALIDLGIDSDGVINGSVATSDIADITTLDISNRYIDILIGIEDFSNLTELYCQNNYLFDVNVSHNTKLKILNCSNQYDDYYEPFTLNVTQNTALEYLNCSNNPDLEGGLNPSLNPNLKTLICSNSGLTSLDVSQNTKLEYLNCANNYYIDWSGLVTWFSNLIVGQNSNLTTLNCSSNEISNLDITSVPNLTYLNCAGNTLMGLGIHQNTNLEQLYCNNNQLTTLHLVNNNSLNEVNCSNNQLTILNVKNGNNTMISTFDASNNELTCIEVDDAIAANSGEAPYSDWIKDDTAVYLEDCESSTAILDTNFEQALIVLGIDTDATLNGIVATADIAGITVLDIFHFGIQDLTGIQDFFSLENLSCYDNELTHLDVSNNLNLEYLYCGENLLTNLDISKNYNLTLLSVTVNQLSNLNVSKNTSLQYLNCSINQLQNLDLSQNTNLQFLDCLANQLTSLNVKNENNSILTVNAIDNPTLTCIQVDDADAANAGIAPYDNWLKDATATYAEDCPALGIDEEVFSKSVSLYPNPVTDILTIDLEIPIMKVEIFSVLGKKIKIFNSDFKSIPIDNLSNGIYIVRVFFDNGFTTKKLIKN